MNELNLLLSQLSADIQFKEDTCYTLVVQYVQNNLVLDPYSNACEILLYIKTHFDCIQQDDDGYLDQPSPIEVIDDKYEHPDPNPENGADDDDEYEEVERSAIWWYHSDHLGSSSYLTDNFGRPTHYYDQLPFGEIGDSPNTKTKLFE